MRGLGWTRRGGPRSHRQRADEGAATSRCFTGSTIALRDEAGLDRGSRSRRRTDRASTTRTHYALPTSPPRLAFVRSPGARRWDDEPARGQAPHPIGRPARRAVLHAPAGKVPVLDVREQAEWNEGLIRGAIHAPCHDTRAYRAAWLGTSRWPRASCAALVSGCYQ